ncbi:MAG: hypothetical protein EOP22_03275 [Hyphomicrobiales bacterium]|nr:MAG: hypothetical protein EOP22_03275 [Hyphomicrobiales bacterium]
MRLERVATRIAESFIDDDICYLVENSWNDFGYQALFEAILFDENSVRHNLGYVRIIEAGMTGGRVLFPSELDELGPLYCSIGSSREYYDNLYLCPPNTRVSYLKAIRDAAFDPDIFAKFENEPGFQKSLLRDVSKRDVTVTFPRMLHGDAKLSRYEFEFRFDVSGRIERLAFKVEPLSRPPTNIHVLIGRNGVGKTRLLAGMADAVTENRAASIGLAGNLVFTTDFEELESEFLNLIVVSYSAFDKFDPIPQGGVRTDKGIPNYYIGIKARSHDLLEQGLGDEELVHLKTSREMVREFEESISLVIGDPNKLERWARAMRTLASDPTINDMSLTEGVAENPRRASETLVEVFATLSSGHKVVMLTMTRLVELVSDRSLILMDEPETHLHPPLLSSFIRALSDLLHSRNAVAVIATHSPVVLQEVPSECVQVIVRSGDSVRALSPEIETFGENVGTLTRRIFGLEVENSGFYRLLADESARRDFKEVMNRFSQRVGSEGRALVRSLTRGL